MKFETPEIKVVAFTVEDIITVSGNTDATEGFNPGDGGVGNGDPM